MKTTPEEQNFLREVGVKIIQLRNAREITQTQLAKALEINRTYLNDIEQGNRNFSVIILNNICEYFEINIEEFLKLGGNIIPHRFEIR